MLSRNIARKILPRVVTRGLSSEAGEATSVTLNFSVPYESIYNGASVFQVIIPGVEGEYGVTPNHVPYVAQLKPGVLQILHEEGNYADSEKYFVAGGYALTHENSVTVRIFVIFVEFWMTSLDGMIFLIEIFLFVVPAAAADAEFLLFFYSFCRMSFVQKP